MFFIKNIYEQMILLYLERMNQNFQNQGELASKQKLSYYQIESVSAGRVLDLCKDGANNGKLIIYDRWGGLNQQFGIVPVSPLEVMLLNKQTGRCLTVANDSDKNGAVIMEEPYAKKRNQRFRVQQVQSPSGQYIIFTFSGKALDCFENQSKNNTLIIQWDFHGRSNQKWRLNKL